MALCTSCRLPPLHERCNAERFIAIKRGEPVFFCGCLVNAAGRGVRASPRSQREHHDVALRPSAAYPTVQIALVFSFFFPVICSVGPGWAARGVARAGRVQKAAQPGAPLAGLLHGGCWYFLILFSSHRFTLICTLLSVHRLVCVRLPPVTQLLILLYHHV